jgi:hypothetical protein
MTAIIMSAQDTDRGRQGERKYTFSLTLTRWESVSDSGTSLVTLVRLVRRAVPTTEDLVPTVVPQEAVLFRNRLYQPRARQCISHSWPLIGDLFPGYQITTSWEECGECNWSHDVTQWWDHWISSFVRLVRNFLLDGWRTAMSLNVVIGLPSTWTEYYWNSKFSVGSVLL